MLLFFTLEERDLLLAKVAKLEAENAALLADLKEADYMGCKHCINASKGRKQCHDDCVDCTTPCVCNECYHNSLWQWRGINEQSRDTVHGSNGG